MTRPSQRCRSASRWLVALALLAGAPLAAADWPQWRGPAGAGVSPDSELPLRWSEGDAAWATRLGGSGVSSPVVGRGRVIVTSQLGAGARKPGRHPQLARNDPEVAENEQPLLGSRSGEGATFLVEAFSPDTGERLWRHELKAEGELPLVHEKHNLASPSAVIDDEAIYAWFGTGQLVALSHAGELLWRRHLGRELGPFELDWGHASSPAVGGELLYLVCFHDRSSTLLALDKHTGRDSWRVQRPAEVRTYSTPTLIEPTSGAELVVNSTEGLHAYAPDSGDLLWHADGEHRFGVGVPSYVDGVLYANRGYRSGPYMAMLPGGRGDVSQSHVRWRVATGAPYVSSLLVYRGLIFLAGDSGIITCADAETGEKLWQERTGAIFSASPVAGDGKVYFAAESGETFVYAPERSPRRLATNSLDGRIVASPAIANDRIFLRTDDRLVAVSN
ncbi:MAG: PQQ-binding-like beta-propeller repeat protein [Acidobacteriota bacterium]|nr:PQQ-binding-like beta-propeller repeat protein [Acidobacteriota bacterium]